MYGRLNRSNTLMVLAQVLCNTSFKLGVALSDSFSFHIFPTLLMIAGPFLKQANGPTDTLSFFSWLNVHICPPSLLFLPPISCNAFLEQVFSIIMVVQSLSHASDLFQNGDTALHIAAAMGRRKLTKILLESGCDKESKNKQGETSLEISRRKNLVDIITILQNPPPLLSQEDRQDQVGQQHIFHTFHTLILKKDLQMFS